jgi:hypothetical protein
LQYDIHDDAKSYMIIESVTNTTSKTIHVINLSEKRKIKVVSIKRIHILLLCRVEGKMLRLELLISVSAEYILL